MTRDERVDLMLEALVENFGLHKFYTGSKIRFVARQIGKDMGGELAERIIKAETEEAADAAKRETTWTRRLWNCVVG